MRLFKTSEASANRTATPAEGPSCNKENKNCGRPWPINVLVISFLWLQLNRHFVSTFELWSLYGAEFLESLESSCDQWEHHLILPPKSSNFPARNMFLHVPISPVQVCGTFISKPPIFAWSIWKSPFSFSIIVLCDCVLDSPLPLVL